MENIVNSGRAFQIFRQITKGDNSPEKLMRAIKLDRPTLSQNMLYLFQEDMLESLTPNQGDKRFRVYTLNQKGFLKQFTKWALKRKNFHKEKIITLESDKIFHKRFEEFINKGIGSLDVETLHDAFTAFCAYFITIERENPIARKAVEIVAQIVFAGMDLPELRGYYSDLLQPKGQ